MTGLCRAVALSLLLSAPAWGQAAPVPQRPVDEAWRPAYHFTPPRHWMNDPNGLVHYRGVWHLFYQHYPDATVWGPMHWGHAISRDLVHWTDLPIALAPDAHGMIFSGSAVVDWHNTTGFSHNGRPPLVAIFTYHDAAAEKAGRAPQSQGLAYSVDGGMHWTKYAGNPVLLPKADQHDFRDPKVFWHAASHRWVMALAVGDHTEFYGSPDLKRWHWLSAFGQGVGAHGGVWECPDLLPLRVAETGQAKWVLLQSSNPGGPNGGSATQYFVGDFDGTRFTPDPGQGVRWLDWGRDDYASVAWSDVPGRTVTLGWMNDWDYGQKVPTGTWRSAMTLPRELTLHRTAGGLALASQPVRELHALEGAPIHLPAGPLVGETPVPLAPDLVMAVKLEAEFAVPAAPTRVGLALSNAGGDVYRFGYDAAGDRYVSDRSHAGDASFSDKFASIDSAPRAGGGRTIRITLYVDRASVEAFADGGRTAMTTTLFPHTPYTRLGAYAEGGSARLLSLTAVPIHRAR
jgi:fructan beta-fructosidase